MKTTEHGTRNTLLLRNRQRTRPVDLRFLRRLTGALLESHLRLSAYELGIHLVGAQEMAVLNETFLGHPGSTDVITFDHAEPAANDRHAAPLHGELFICVDDAVAQARQFRTSWPAEVVRYVVHGVLHLRGFDDLRPAARRKMKREETRLVRVLAGEFSFARLERPARANANPAAK